MTIPERSLFSAHNRSIVSVHVRVLDATMAVVEERLVQNGIEPLSTSIYVPSRWFAPLQAICSVAPEGGDVHLVWRGTHHQWPAWAWWGKFNQDCVFVQDEVGRVLEKVQLPPHDEMALWRDMSAADVATAVRVFAAYSSDGLPTSDLVRLGAALAASA